MDKYPFIKKVLLDFLKSCIKLIKKKMGKNLASENGMKNIKKKYYWIELKI